MNKVLSLILTLVAALSGVLTPSAATAAPSSGPDLPTAYMVGLDIHTPSGTVVHVPVAAKHGRSTSTALLGRSPLGWVVATGGWFYLVADGEATRIARRAGADPYVTEMLSDDGQHIISATSVQADHVGVHVYDLDGTLVGQAGRENVGGDIKDADDGRVYVAGADGVDVVTMGSDEAVRVLNRGADLVSVERDTVFVRVSKKNYHRYGPTSLSDPGSPLWRAEFNAHSISPAGTYVLGATGQVRRMSDGSVVRTLALPRYDDSLTHTMGWANDRVVLHVISKGGREALVRCDVISGRCRQLTPLTPRTVSLPTKAAGPHVLP